METYSKKSSISHRKSDTESELYSPIIIQELLQGVNEWTHIQDIIKLTFKATVDVLKTQGDAIRSLEKSMASKATKAEVNQKASIADVSKTVAEVAANIESRATLEELQQLLETKANKSDLQQILKNKGNTEDFSSKSKADIEILSSKVDRMKSEIESMVHSMNELKRGQKMHGEILDTNKKELSSALMKKVDFEDARRLMNQAYPESLRSIEERINEVERTISESEAQYKKNELGKIESGKQIINIEREINKMHMEINEEIKKLNELIEARDKELKKLTKEQLNSFKTNISNLKTNFDSEIGGIKNDVDNNVNKLMESHKSTQIELKKLKENALKLEEGQHTKAEIKSEVQKELIALRKEIEILAQNKCERKELQEFSKDLREKVNLEEVRNALSTSKAETARRLVELSEEQQLQWREISKELELKVNKDELQAELGKKVDKCFVESLYEQKANIADIEIVRSRLGNLQAEVNKKANVDEFNTQSIYVKESIEVIKREIGQKANIKDVCALIDIKANLEDVDKGFEELEQEITTKTENLKSALNNQAKIYQTLCTENCAGRWFWKSGAVKSGYVVPWEMQAVNTCPDNFLWEKGKISILTVAAGVYEVSIGFFASRKPKVQFLVNGEPILTPINSSKYYFISS